jgi:leader peptidase (prepilin peptidase) / N-methyltransferase
MMNTLQVIAANPTLFLILVAILSLFIGSFLNVVIYRLPLIMEQHLSEECRSYLGLKPYTTEEKISLSLPFSHCPRCKQLIRPWHNIPVFSFLWLRGKCANCSCHISLRYPFIEALTCIASVVIAFKFGFTFQTLAALFFTWIAICLIFIDLDHHLLPDQLTLLLLWIGLFSSLFSLFCNSFDAIIGAILGYLIFAITQLIFGFFTGKIGIGQGDFKFLAGMGAFLGWQMLPFIILLASITGIILTCSQMLIKRSFKSVPLPFGPYLAIAGWIALLWGPFILRSYFELIR